MMWLIEDRLSSCWKCDGSGESSSDQEGQEGQ